ncbi:MAG: hypothetical protein IPM34_06990 [Saprospiraceae bacterium]|nr:hypothetical protein [Saprospiraceae bacterium]
MKPLTQFQLLFFASCLFVASNCKTSKDSGVTIKMDWGNQTISIDAQNQPLSKVLRQMEVQEEITVQIEDFEEKQVNLTIQNQPLEAALVHLIGTEKRYLLNVGKRELVIKGVEGSKEGRKPTSKDGLNPKYQVKDTSQVRQGDIPTVNVKKKVEEIELAESDGRSGSKRTAKEIATLKDSVFIKKDKRIVQTQDGEGYVRLRFRLEGDVIKVEKALILSGELTVPPVMVSDYIYTVEMDGKIIAIGSFQDPLEMHSYYPEPEKEHELLEAKIGHFDISIPGKLVNPKKLKSISMQFYKVEGAISTPTVEIKQFEEIQKSLKRVTRIILSSEDFPIEDLTRQ